MALTIIPGSHEPKPHPSIKSSGDVHELLQQACPDSYVPGETRIVASSFAAHPLINGTIDSEIYPSSSSFVRSAIEAWGRHSHLIIRPDDIWFSILVQMNFYMEKNANSLRHLFVSHKDKKELVIEHNTWPEVIDSFRVELHKNIKTDWMADWVSPGFTTSTDDDETTATVLMMGLMKAYFDYSGGIVCGIPSITLLGTKADWQRLLDKAGRLKEFSNWPGISSGSSGAASEPTKYYERLHPILTRIVGSFDDPTSAETKDFWNNIVQAKIAHSNLCGAPPRQYMVSGWILGLFYWDKTGTPNSRFSKGEVRWPYPSYKKEFLPVQYDGVQYGVAPLDDIPIGYAKAQFKMLNEHGGPEEYKGWILAGSIGKRITSGAPEGYYQAIGAGTDGAKKELKARAEETSAATSCSSGFFSSLNCLCGKHSTNDGEPTTPPYRPVMNEKLQVQRSSSDAPDSGHSTIQPLSGWFLFGPEKDVGPFYDDDEISGPTVDALESCEKVERFGHSGYVDYDKDPPEDINLRIQAARLRCPHDSGS